MLRLESLKYLESFLCTHFYQFWITFIIIKVILSPFHYGKSCLESLSESLRSTKSLPCLKSWMPSLLKSLSMTCDGNTEGASYVCNIKQEDYRSMQSNLTLSSYFPWQKVCFCSLFLVCVFILKAIITNFLEDRDMGILFLSSKFELDQSTNNRDLLSDRNRWKHKNTDTHTHRLNLILSPYKI